MPTRTVYLVGHGRRVGREDTIIVQHHGVFFQIPGDSFSFGCQVVTVDKLHAETLLQMDLEDEAGRYSSLQHSSLARFLVVDEGAPLKDKQNSKSKKFKLK